MRDYIYKQIKLTQTFKWDGSAGGSYRMYAFSSTESDFSI